MKKRVVKVKVLLVLVSAMFLCACGGGSSDSGGAQNNVTSCVTTEARINSFGLTETTLRNNCDFAVNLGRGVASISTIVTLESGGTDITLLVGGFIACRPPSQPFDRDDSAARDFACTD